MRTLLFEKMAQNPEVSKECIKVAMSSNFHVREPVHSVVVGSSVPMSFTVMHNSDMSPVTGVGWKGYEMDVGCIDKEPDLRSTQVPLLVVENYR